MKFDKDFNQLKVTVEVTLSTFVHENGEINDRVVDKTEESDEISPLYCWFRSILILFCWSKVIIEVDDINNDEALIHTALDMDDYFNWLLKL